MIPVPVVLASASPRRKALLDALGLDVEVMTSTVDEVSGGAPDEAVRHNAQAKRDDVVKRLAIPAVVVAADTLVVLDGRILGKPADLDEACAMLEALSGNTHQVLTGVAVVDTQSGRTADGVEATRVRFRSLSGTEIRHFVDAVRPLDRAGAYTVDGPGSLLVESYDGCYQNVLGLPIVRLDALFREIGDNLFTRVDGRRAQFL